MKTNALHFAKKFLRSFIGFTLLMQISISLSAQSTIAIGTATSINSSSAYPAPYGNYYWGSRHQILILASELQALAASAGRITSLAFSVGTAQGEPLQGFTISMGTTTATSISTWESGLTQVYTTTSYTETAGWNTHTFQSPFFWDGVSNIIVETCFNNTGYTNNAQMHYTATPFTSVVEYHTDASGVCTNSSTSSTSSNRPNMQMTFAPNLSIDAGISAITNPVSHSSTGTQDIKAILKNYGTSNLTSTTINWSVNGIIQTPYNWNGNLGAQTTTGELTIGSYNFSSGYSTIKVWSSAPNAQTDSSNYNDTITETFYFGTTLSGTYLVGGTNADYPTINAAVNAMSNAGVSGPVTFLIIPGVYTEQVMIPEILGASSVNTITFQAFDTISTDSTVIQFTGTSSNNYVLQLNGADYIIFKHLILKALDPTNGRVVELINGANHNLFESNTLYSIGTTSTSAGFYDNTTLNNYNTFRQNIVNGGYYGFYLKGVSSSSWEKGNVLEKNIINNPYYYGIYSYYQDSIQIDGNQLYKSVNSNGYGIYAYYTMNCYSITNNNVKIFGTSSLYGIYDAYGNYYSYNPNPTGYGLVANNMVYLMGGSTNYGIYTYYTNGSKYFFNTVKLDGGGTSSRAIYQYNSATNPQNQSFKNNIFINSGGGYAAYFGTVTKVSDCDYNCYYTTGTNLAFWGSNMATFTDLKSASGKDSNSVVENPVFMDSLDLHLASPISTQGTHIPEVITDIDGEIRSVTAPTIGADEVYTLPVNLIAFYPFNGNANDLSTNGYHGTLNGAGGFATDRFGINNSAFNFTGSASSYISVPDNTDFKSIKTISLWFNNTVDGSDTYSKIMVAKNSNYYPGISYWPYGHEVRFWENITGSSIELRSDSNFTYLQKGTWHHAAIVLNGDSAKLYVDGFLVDSDTLTYNPFNNTNELKIGGGVTGRYFTGKLDDIRFFNTPLNSAEIVGLYQEGGWPIISNVNIIVDSGLVAYYPFNGDANDYSGHNYHGTPTTSPSSATGYDGNANSAYYFTNNYINCGNPSNGDFDFINSGTICMWAKLKADVGSGYWAYNPVIGKDVGPGATNKWFFYMNNGGLFFHQNSPSGGDHFGAATVLQTDTFYHIAFTKDSSNLYKFYVNGSLIGSYTTPYSIVSNTANLQIGIQEALTTNTVIDEVYFYNRVLSESEIASVMTGTYVMPSDPLSGIYTIGSTGPRNFASFNAAVQALDSNGVSGSVVFNVASGTYNEQVTIPEITGASAINTITFQKENSSSTDSVLIQFSANSTNNYVVRLNGADYIRFKNMTFIALNSTYGRVVEVFNGANYNIFDNNHLYSSNTGSIHNACFYDSIPTNNFNIYQNNRIFGGYYGMFLYGSNYSFEQGTIIENNEIINPFFYGIYSYFQDAININKNKISIAISDRTSGINSLGAINNYRITNNQIVASATSVSKGIEDTYGNYYSYNPNPTTFGLVANNMILITGGNTGIYGLTAYRTNGTNYLNNTIKISGGGTNGCGIFQGNEAANSVKHIFKNNIFVNTAGGYAAYYGDYNEVGVCDFNCYYSTGTTLVGWNGAQANLANLKVASGKDSNSIEYNPTFIDTFDLHLSSQLSGFGTPVSEVTTDIDGDMRSANAPTIGADEFYTPPPPPSYIIVGTGTTANTSGSYPAPYGNYYWGAKHQMLVRASELIAAGASAGQFTGLGFDVVTESPVNLTNFEIKIGTTTDSSITSWHTGLSSVYLSPSYNDNLGWNSHVFTTPFNWDGVSNLIIETCFANNAWTANAVMRITSTSFSSTYEYHADDSLLCSTASNGMSYQVRPNIRFEMTSKDYDAAIINLTPPIAGGYQPVKIDLKNFGKQNLTSATLGWSVNGVIQTPVSWTGLLLQGYSDTAVLVGNHNFGNGFYNLKVWVYNPNGMTDQNTDNDTVAANFYITIPMSGVYIIGSDTSADYASFSLAVADLSLRGVSGAVIFDVKPGTYNEAISVAPILGASSTNTITFRSQTGDSSDVIIQNAADSSHNNFVVELNETGFFRFHNLTFKSLSTSYSTILKMINNCYNIEFKGSVFISSSAFSNDETDGAIAFLSGSSLSDITFENNKFEGGTHGIFLSGNSNAKSKRIFVLNNQILNNSYYGIRMSNTDSVFVQGNTIISKDSSWTFNAVYVYYTDGYSKISQNKIINRARANFYGIQISNKASTNSNPIEISNNFVTTMRTVQYYTGALMINNTSFANIYHNTLRIKGSNIYNSYSMKISTSSGINVKNNIFTNENQGWTYHIDNMSAISSSNNNAFFSGSNMMAFLGSTYSSLADIKTNTNLESNSIVANPYFTDYLDFYPKNYLLNGVAAYLSTLPTDIDGALRNTQYPDMGAIEFNPPLNDAGILSITTSNACEGQQNVVAELKNFGSNNLTSATINWKVNGVLQSPFSWTGNLASSDTVFVILDTNFITIANQSYSYECFTTLPNSQNDAVSQNDTFLITNQTYHPNPIISFSNVSTKYCQSESFSYIDAYPSGGNMTINGNQTNLLSPSMLGVGSIEIIYTVQNYYGCSSSDTFHSEVIANPVVEITTVFNASYCDNEPGFVISASPFGGNFTGSIYSDYFNPATVGQGNQTIYYSYTDSSGCVGIDTAYTVVYPTTSVQIISSLNAEYCNNASSVSLTAYPPSGSFSGSGVAGNTFHPSAATPGLIDIVYSYINAYGCSDSDFVSTIVRSIPSVQINTTLASSYCSNDTAFSLVASPTGGLFSGSIHSNIFDPSSLNLGLQTIYFSITDSFGCSNSDTAFTTILQSPDAVILSPLFSQYCTNAQPLALIAYPTTGTFTGSGVSGNIFTPANATPGNVDIVYSVTSANGCSDADTVSTLVYNASTVAINTVFNSDYCSNEPAFAISASPSGGIFSSAVDSAWFDPAVQPVGNQAIIYSFSDSVGCGGSDTVWVNVKTAPVVAMLTTLNSQYCTNQQPVTLFASPSGGTFTGSGVSGNIFTPANAALGNIDIVYSVTSANGCSDADTVSTLVYNASTVAINTVFNSAYCSNEPAFAISASPSGGIFSGAVDSAWFDPANLPLGAQTIIYTFSDSVGCGGSDTVTTFIKQQPLVSITNTDNQEFCSNNSTVILAALPSGGSFVGSGVSGNIFDPATANSGAITIHYNYTAANGCQNSDSVSWTVHLAPVVSLTNQADVCENAGSILLSGGTPSGGIYFGNAVNSQQAKFSPNFAGVGTHSLSYIVTDSNNCSDTASATIKVVTVPIAEFTTPSTICVNDTATIVFSGTAGSTAVYSWGFGSPAFAGGTNEGPYQILWDTAGIKNVSLTILDSGCYSLPVSKYTNVLSTYAMITAVGSTSLCYGDSIVLFANSGLNYSYQWFDSSGALPNDTLSYIIVKNSGDYYCHVSPPNACAGISNIINVDIKVQVLADFSLPNIACQDDLVTINFTGTAGPTAQYHWDFDGGVIASGSNSGPYSIIWDTDSIRNVSLYISDDGCTSSMATKGVSILTTPATITALGSTSFCSGNSVTLSANGGPYSYSWFKNGVAISNSSALLNVSQAGYYQVEVTNNSTTCSTMSDSMQVVVNSSTFNLAFSANPTSFSLPPFNTTITNQTPNANDYYWLWSFGDGSSSTNVNPTHHYQYDGTYTVQAIAEKITTGCRDTLLKNNYIVCNGGSSNPCTLNSQIGFIGNSMICPGDSVKLFSKEHGSGVLYQWLKDGVLISGKTDSVFYAKVTGMYQVMVLDPNCSVFSQPFSLSVRTTITPVILANGSIQPCSNDSMELYVSTSFNSYLWSNGAVTPVVYVKTSGSYIVSVTDNYGCKTTSAPYVVNASLAQPPQICIVGVDSATNSNRIIWERQTGAMLDSFRIYRESNIAGVYNLIAAQPFSAPGIFVDANSNPAQQSYRYRITGVDSCGMETSPSDFHKTIHLTINAGMNGSWNLIWSGYQGFSFGSYRIYRGSDSANLQLLTQIQSTLNSFTDLNPPSGKIYYQIEIVSPHACYPDSVYTKAQTNYNTSRSNTANTAAVPNIGFGKSYDQSLSLRVFPNPNNGQFTLEVQDNENRNLNLTILNTLGSVVYKDQFQTRGYSTKSLDLSHLSKGVYYLRITGNDGIIAVEKVVIR